MTKTWKCAKVLIAVAAILAMWQYGASAAAPVGKSSFSAVKEYVPKDHAKCATNYKRETITLKKRVRVRLDGAYRIRVQDVRTVGCVYVKPKTVMKTVTPVATTTTAPSATTTSQPASTLNLAVRLDPSFVASASNPLSVVYTASAAASQTIGSEQSELASLPSGVLNFYSDGSLACSTNVGGSDGTTTCPVTYATAGEHTVVTEYVSGTNSATETDVEDIQDYNTTTTVSLTGDPAQGATTSTLTATVSSNLGTDTTPADGAISFLVDGVTFTTEATNQTDCTLDWIGPTFSQSADAYMASATSPNCVGGQIDTGTMLTYSASFDGSIGLGSSTSAVASDNDWPTVPAPITQYVTGDPYELAIGNASLIDNPNDMQLNAPTLTLVDASTSQPVYGDSSSLPDGGYFWLATTLADSNGNAFIPGTGDACSWESATDSPCELGSLYYTAVPNPLVATFTVTPTPNYLIDAPAAISWNGNQKTINITTHALVGSESVQTLTW